MSDSTTPATPRTEEFRSLTREDVARDAGRALETLSTEDRATVEGKAPSVILGLAFRRAQTAWCADRRERTAEESAAYERCANLASAAMIFEREDDPAAAADAMAEDRRITNGERAAESKRREEAYARALDAQWRDAETFGAKGYKVRTEDRGHGIIAVYVMGPASDIKGIESTSRAYARARLTFAPGMSMGAVGGGGEFCNKGATYISQDVHVTQPLTVDALPER
ncbi:hypothetical protein [Streptomyces sp. NPDC059278]|uniref:hypothetical protein n=1 Tax=Streptomyces sp. NPDC059278 TaxID=3346801 RepID=UPI0036BDCCAD